MKNFLSKNKRKLIIIGVILLLFISYSAVEPFFLTRDNVNISSNEIGNDLDGYKIVYVSDIHNGPYMSANRLNDLLNLINDENADIILLGGDYIKNYTEEFNTVFEFVSKLKSKDGVYYILGNHEYRSDIDFVKTGMENSGATLLYNNSIRIIHGNDSINIIGTDDFNEGKIDLQSAYLDAKQEDFTILLSHNPKILPSLSEEQIRDTDLALFGHTHGGQVTFFGMFTLTRWQKPFAFYTDSIQNYNGLDFIISNGFGVSGLPFRFMALPQYHVIELEKEHE